MQIFYNYFYWFSGWTKGIVLSKSKIGKKCTVCHYWCSNHGFHFQKIVCNGCHDLLMMSPDIDNIKIIFAKGIDDAYIIYGVGKYNAIHLLENPTLNDDGFI